jgi:hypothetical protein
VRVLFVGEGPHDIGRHGPFDEREGARHGVVQILARKVCPHIADDSPALRWSDVPRFHPTKRGFGAKMKAAALQAERKFACEGVVFVADRDRDDDRVRQIEEGRRSLGDTARVATGIACESIEAWTLGALSALAATLGVEERAIRARLPGVHVEKLFEHSGHVAHRPKALLETVAELGGRSAGQDLRVDVAAETDPDQLARACPDGFAPFVASLRAAFGEPTSS